MNSKKALERLRELLGDEQFAQVVNELAGVTVYFPENHKWTDKVARNLKLREDFYSGRYEVGDLAKKYDLSISRVYKIIQSRA